MICSLQNLGSFRPKNRFHKIPEHEISSILFDNPSKRDRYQHIETVYTKINIFSIAKTAVEVALINVAGIHQNNHVPLKGNTRTLHLILLQSRTWRIWTLFITVKILCSPCDKNLLFRKTYSTLYFFDHPARLLLLSYTTVHWFNVHIGSN